VRGVHHVLQGRVQELLGDFWIESADEFGRVFDVREEYRHLLALTGESVPGGTDLLGQVCRYGGE